MKDIDDTLARFRGRGAERVGKVAASLPDLSVRTPPPMRLVSIIIPCCVTRLKQAELLDETLHTVAAQTRTGRPGCWCAIFFLDLRAVHA